MVAAVLDDQPFGLPGPSMNFQGMCAGTMGSVLGVDDQYIVLNVQKGANIKMPGFCQADSMPAGRCSRIWASPRPVWVMGAA